MQDSSPATYGRFHPENTGRRSGFEKLIAAGERLGRVSHTTELVPLLLS
jgi:hypothetical protein